jgi:hypothetical protein
LKIPASCTLRPGLAALAFTAVSFCAHAQPVMPHSAMEWRQAAIQDIEEAVRITLDNHPGPYDPANPGFRAKLESAKKEGLALAARADGAAGYTFAVIRFHAALDDGHAGMYPDFDQALPADRWPGFVAAWRGQDLYVYAAEDGGPAAGSKIVACDGKPIQDLIRQNVFAFAGGADKPGHWWTRAAALFIDNGNPFITVPAHCEFVSNGKTSTHRLTWKARTEQARQWRKESYNGQTLDVGLTEPRPRLFWAAMPTFQPDESQREAYRAMVREIGAHRQRFLDADAVVIDLRDNQGGSSVWSEQFAKALWGADRVERRMNAWTAGEEVWWRASKGNADYLASLVEKFTSEKQVESLEWAKRKSAGLRAALARGDTFFVEKDDTPAATAGNVDADRPTDPPPFTKPVYVIVPGQCASACLDALDRFTRFSNTRLIGAPSSTDSTYMEVRYQKVHSGLATVIIPTKMYVNRPRANGQAYLPSIYVNDLDWSVDTFLKVVEKDLARQTR